MYNGYTYKRTSKRNPLYYCSKRKFGCKASVKLNENGDIGQVFEDHGHDPPQYLVTADGEYVKV